MINQETRIQEISNITNNPKLIVGNEPLLWDEKIDSFEVYNIPLKYLVYNRYNGRILSRTKSIENSRDRKLDMEKKEDFDLIARLLEESNISRNNQTLKDLQKKGQLKTGIITSDGIIIDGNRRAMLLNKLQKQYFRTIVLPIKLEDDPMKIEELETTYQMGEDEKLNYNPIEKYLKAHQLFTKLEEIGSEHDSIKTIADWMGEEKSEIEQYLATVKLIDQYLIYLEYDGIYAMADTPKDGKEDLFLNLKKWLTKFEDKESADGFKGYDNFDVQELKYLCFDYIRAKIGKSYDGKDFRNIADGRRNNQLFGNKDIWESFKKRHEAIVKPIKEKIDREMPVDSSSSANIEKHLSARDIEFKNAVLQNLKDNMSDHLTTLGFRKASEQPKKLVSDAQKALQEIHSKVLEQDTLNDIAKVSELTANLLRTNSISALVQQIEYSLTALEDIDLKKIQEDEDEIFFQLKELRKLPSLDKIAYELEKKLKSNQ